MQYFSSLPKWVVPAWGREVIFNVLGCLKYYCIFIFFQETPVKAKRNIIAEPTQAYTLAAGIEPTQAYNMDDESNDGSKESEVCFH